jgi:hypothetical protein
MSTQSTVKEFMEANGISPSFSIDETIATLPYSKLSPLPTPRYTGPQIDSRRRIAMAVESMRLHMTDEGWQIMEGLGHNGYLLCGHNLPVSTCNTNIIIGHLNPSIVVLQDKREWDTQYKDFREPLARFYNIQSLKQKEDIFKLTILKDSHQKPEYHRESADEIGCHAWIIYYHPKIVSYLARYVRPQHLIRTFHSVNNLLVPPYSNLQRSSCLLSGAISNVYPLRVRIANAHASGVIPELTYMRHPGYHRNGTHTPEFLKILSRFKVSICTSSIYGYALRKIIESTACGCIVITDLPTDEVLPFIDGNLVRISPHSTPEQVRNLILYLARTYDPNRQESYALLAKKFYDYRATTSRLDHNIESIRESYNGLNNSLTEKE